MSNTITLRVPKGLASWLREKSAKTGISQSQLIKDQLERIRMGDKAPKSFMRLAGTVKRGPRDLSTRKGFSKK
jgi:hypothetical protein